MFKLLTVFFLGIIIIPSFNANGQCPPSGGGSFVGSITITTACTVSSSLTLTRNNITINAGGSLTITGNFTNSGNGNITLNGGTLITSGSFSNTGNGTVTVTGGGDLDVGTDYTNGRNGTTNFTDGTVAIGGNFSNEGNGNIAAGGIVSVGGNFDVSGNGTTVISGGLAVEGTATFTGNGGGGNGVTIDGGVFQAETLVSDGLIDIGPGGTLFVESGSITGTVVNDPTNADQDCTNNCCGTNCTTTGNELNDTGIEILPIKLLYFNVKAEDGFVAISWTSASETNNDYYEIERATSGSSFVSIASIDGAGNSQEALSYYYNDYTVQAGLVYYRLRQTDYDGKFEYFQIKSVGESSFSDSPIDVFPNFAKVGDKINIVGLPFNDNYHFKLIDLSGKTSINIKLNEFGSKSSFSVPKVPPGVYLISSKEFGIVFQQKIIISEN